MFHKEMPGIEPGAFHMQSERATTALHPLLMKDGTFSKNRSLIQLDAQIVYKMRINVLQSIPSKTNVNVCCSYCSAYTGSSTE